MSFEWDVHVMNFNLRGNMDSKELLFMRQSDIYRKILPFTDIIVVRQLRTDVKTEPQQAIGLPW